MRIAVAREIDPGEDRVAATPETIKKMKGLGADVAVRAGGGAAAPPETIKKMKGLGADVAVEPGAGTKSGIPDSEFAAAGATVTDAVTDADVVLKVRRP